MEKEEKCFSCGEETTNYYEYLHFRAALCSTDHLLDFHCNMSQIFLDDDLNVLIDRSVPFVLDARTEVSSDSLSTEGEKTPCFACGRETSHYYNYQHFEAALCCLDHKEAFHREFLESCLDESGKFSVDLLPLAFKKPSMKRSRSKGRSSKSSSSKSSSSGSRSKSRGRSGSPLKKIKGKAKSAKSGLKNRSKSPLVKIKGKTKSTTTNLKNRSKSPLKKVKQSASSVKSRSKSPINKIKNKTKSATTNIKNRSKSPIAKVKSRSKSPVKSAAGLLKNPLRSGSGATSRTRLPFRGKKNTKSLNPIKRLSGSGKTKSSSSSSSKSSGSSSSGRGSKPLPSVPKTKKGSGSSSSSSGSGSKPLPSVPKTKKGGSSSSSSSGSKPLPKTPKKRSSSSGSSGSGSGSKPLPATPKTKKSSSSSSSSGSGSVIKPLPKTPTKKVSDSGSSSSRSKKSPTTPQKKRSSRSRSRTSESRSGSEERSRGSSRSSSRSSSSSGSGSSSTEREGEGESTSRGKKSTLQKLTKVAKSSGRVAKSAAQSGARTVSKAVSKARSVSPSLRPRIRSGSGSGSFSDAGSVSDNDNDYEREPVQRESVQQNPRSATQRSSGESSEEREERKVRRDFYENRNKPQSVTQQNEARAATYSEREVLRNAPEWSGRYGYGSGWKTRYKWFPSVFTPSVYAVWFPHTRWEPYYILDDSFITAYERDFTVPPNSAYIINNRVQWPQKLPQLPKFKEVGIDLGGIRHQAETLSGEEMENVMKVQHDINEKLAELKLRYNTYVNRGYWPVPDLDREQFSWVKIV